MSLYTTNYNFIKPELTDAPPDITVMNPNWDKTEEELKNRLPLDGSGTMTGNLVTQRTIGSDVHQAVLYPSIYTLGDLNTVGITHKINGTTDAMLYFNRDSVALFNAVDTTYNILYGRHNKDTVISDLGMPQIATGSYTGTGNAGSSYPNSLTFDFVPKIVAVYAWGIPNKAGELYSPLYRSGSSYTHQVIWMIPVDFLQTSYKTSYHNGFGFESFAKVSSDKKTISWYQEDSKATYQLNERGYTYYYFAIG